MEKTRPVDFKFQGKLRKISYRIRNPSVDSLANFSKEGNQCQHWSTPLLATSVSLPANFRPTILLPVCQCTSGRTISNVILDIFRQVVQPSECTHRDLNFDSPKQFCTRTKLLRAMFYLMEIPKKVAELLPQQKFAHILNIFVK